MRNVSMTVFALFLLVPHAARAQQAEAVQPNIVMIYTDDMGYGDLSCFGATDLATPHLDRLAERGAKLTNFYNSSSACCTSRAALLTGCYHARVSMKMVGPSSTSGLHPDEITLAEMLNDVGYQSAMVGKWHVGHTTNMMPWAQGFERFYGIPVSHDYNNGGADYPEGVPLYSKEPGEAFMLEDVIGEWDLPKVALYTQHFTDRAISYIEQRDPNQPMFLYVAYCMPHVTLAVTEAFEGTSERGLYGDVMQEIDANIGRIIASLEAEGLAENTLVIFASDNGPWLNYGNHAGSPGPLREGKRTVFDGGVRTPAIMYWPSRIAPAQVVDTPAGIIDIFPTVAALAGGALPTDRAIDGVDIRSLVMTDVNVPYDPERPIALYDYRARNLHALRSGRWKLVFQHSYETVQTAGRDGTAGSYEWVTTPQSLFDMEDDPGETTNVLRMHPELVARLTDMAEVFRTDIGDLVGGAPASDFVRPMGSGSLLKRPIGRTGEEPAGDELVAWDFSALGVPGADNSALGGDTDTREGAPVTTVLGAAYANAAARVEVSDLSDGGSDLVYSSGSPTVSEANLKNWDLGGDGLNDNYLEFTVSAGPNRTISIRHISISQWRNGLGAPDGLAFEVSADGDAFEPYGIVRTDPFSGDGVFDRYTFTQSITKVRSVVIRFTARSVNMGSTGNLHINGLTVYGETAGSRF